MLRLLPTLLLTGAILLAGCAGSTKDTTSDPAPSSPSPSATSSSSPPSSASGTSTSSSSSPSPSPPQPRSAKSWAKDITDNNFPDGSFTVQKGDTVTWTHKGTGLHSVSTTAGSAESFDSSPNCPPACILAGATYPHKFDVLGNVTYHCKVHASMVGTIQVVPVLPA